MDRCEYADDLELPDAVRFLPAFKRTHCSVSEHVALLNDIYSVKKDGALDSRHNAVHILHAQDGCTYQEAVDRVNDLCTDITYQLLDAEKELDAQCRTAGFTAAERRAVQRCVELYNMVFAGNFIWHQEAARFSALDHLMFHALSGPVEHTRIDLF